MAWWPGCLQLAFAVTSVVALTQTTFLRKPWFRKWAGIQPLPPKPDPNTVKSSSPYIGTMNVYQAPTPDAPLEQKPKGIIGGAISEIKSTASQVMKSTQKMVESKEASKQGRRTKAEARQAQAYEERRQREIAQEKFEKEQDKKERRRERR